MTAGLLAAAPPETTPSPNPRSLLGRLAFSRAQRRALVSFSVVMVFWQLGATSAIWLGYRLPFVGNLPAPTSVLSAWRYLLFDAGYWRSFYVSALRVAVGFVAALIAGVPFALLMAMIPAFRGIAFPVFELLRPIPPLAWVPAAIIFWPTQELSIDFVIFLGAFYTIVLNVLGGASSVDARYLQAARSMGASEWNIFRRLILPAVLPSLTVSMEVSIGITWEVVVAAEMISGGGSGSSAASGGGLGFLIWSSYVGGSYPQIIVGMISIGIAGYLSSAVVRRLSSTFTPWLEPRK
jgi:NitT/TauT family transport system permease protein